MEIVDAAEVGPVDLRWEKRAEELELEALAKVRGAAEKWGATLTAILGLVATVLVVKGAEDVTKLSSGTKIAVAIVLALALIAAFVAAYLAALAAQGTPKGLAWPSGPTLRAWERREAVTAKRELFWSRIATGAAVLAMAAAIALAWFGDRAEGSGSTVLITPTGGTPVCGALVNGDRGVELEVGSGREALPPGPYGQVVVVESCPQK